MSVSILELIRQPAMLVLGAMCGSLVAGALACTALWLAERRWAALAARRAVWLGAQLTVALAACAALLPPQARPGLLMSTDGPVASAAALAAQAPYAPLAAMALPAPLPATPATPGASVSPMPDIAAQAVAARPSNAGSAGPALTPARTGAAAAAMAASAPQGRAIASMAAALSALSGAVGAATVAWLAAFSLLLYSAGLLATLLRLQRTRRLWAGLLASAQRLDTAQLAAHGGFTRPQLEALSSLRLTVLETDAAISPLLIGVLKRRLLLPRHLRTFSPEQQTLVIEHELYHWRRRDPLWQSLSATLQIIIWFNPAMRWMGRRLSWAQELGCDSQVLAGRPQQQRKLYASALLRQWKLQSTSTPHAAIAFGGGDGATVAGRVRLMQQPCLPNLSARASCGVAALLASALAGGVLLQPAWADGVHRPGAAETAAPAPVAMPFAAPGPSRAAEPANYGSAPAPVTDLPSASKWRYPLEHMRVTSYYGVQRDVLPTPHRGIDLSAAGGTPVHSVAGGTVVAAGPLAENGGRYGIGVIIEHGGVRSLYAHLSKVNVQAGDHVLAGQVIAASGATGFATGPHLHFETLRGGQRIDPRIMLPDLDRYATTRALRIRRQQLGS
ncbi:M23/M56 family metallopeptidase [Oxalobacteraceae bacterium A2-2]